MEAAIVRKLSLFLCILLHGANLFYCYPTNGALPCNEDICKLPDCFCSGTKIPGGLSPKDVPQMVMITFDDAVNIRNFPIYEQLLNNGATAKKNPNGCNITATFFVSHKYTNYRMVEALHHWRHEIADHSITHRTPTTWWKNATYDEWNNEIAGQQEILRKFGSIIKSDVRGFRSPYLQLGGNRQFKVLFDNKFLYDCSMPTLDKQFWPYTLDYKTTQECTVGPCPTDSFPGLWEVPMTDYTDSQGEPCAMVDECSFPKTVEGVYNLLMDNFKKHYNGNRSPFPMFMHAGWLITYNYSRQGLENFLNDILKMKDVYIVTLSQVIDWIKKPTPLSKINEFAPWQCTKPAPPAPCQVQNSCEYQVNNQNEYVYLRTCTRPCPKNYPWYGNPDGN